MVIIMGIGQARECKGTRLSLAPTTNDEVVAKNPLNATINSKTTLKPQPKNHQNSTTPHKSTHHNSITKTHKINHN